MLMRGAAGEAGFQGNGARGGKLSLRRKRPLVLEEDEGEGQPTGGGTLRSCASTAPQFQRQGDAEGEGAWMTLLRALEPHPDPSSVEEIANLPVFLPKSSQTANPEPEAFHVGTKAFQWFPFPVYQRQSVRENGRRNPSNDDTLLQGGSSLNESASVLPSRDPRPASFGDQGETEHPTLEKCPLCQMCFPATWSGLEVDSHLSLCLSESADDVVW